MDSETWLNLGLVLVFVLVGGVFAATELALVSLRESQLARMEEQSARGAKVASLARDPNRFLAAVQIGVTVAGFLSAAYGASTLAPDFAPVFRGLGLSESAAGNVALVVMTLFIAYLSLVLGELVPKRFALQKSAPLALIVAPPLSRFATIMRPVIWFLSLSTNTVVRLLGGDPHAKNEEMSEEELRDIVGAHEGLEDEERRILRDVFAATDRSVKEVMRPRGEVAFLDGDQSIADAIATIRDLPHSRYPVIGRTVDDLEGFVHVRDLLDTRTHPGATTVQDVSRTIVALPSTAKLLPAMTQMRRQGVHMAAVIDEYGGTDGIVTLEDLIEELVGEIRDEYDQPEDGHDHQVVSDDAVVDAGINLEDFEERTGVELEDGSYETVAGFVIDRLGHMPAVGDAVETEGHRIEVLEVEGHRLTSVRISPRETEPEVDEDAAEVTA
ncbi:MAG: hemolysin family protein [Nocardioidaceae bacterium]|nr:hemolysin family protein [Nocardioidaceae bacterium]